MIILIPTLYLAIFWIVLAIVLAIIEAETQGIVSLWFSIGAIFSFFASLSRVPISFQVLIFVIISSLLLIFLRPFAKNYLKIKPEKTNADRLVGEKGEVLETIDNTKRIGQVKILGQVWSACSSTEEKIEKNELVVVEKISGVRLYVKKDKQTI